MIDPTGHAKDVVIADMRAQLARAQRAFMAMQEELQKARFIGNLLAAALEEFGQHKAGCESFQGKDCSCGLASIVVADDPPPAEKSRIITND